MKDPKPDYTATLGNRSFQEMNSPERKERTTLVSPRYQHKPWQKAVDGILNKKRWVARAEVYELNGRDASTGPRNIIQEQTVSHDDDDEETHWLQEESRNDLELHRQSSSISSKGFRGTDGNSTSTLGGKSEKP